MKRSDVESILAGPAFSPLDRRFADLMERLAGGNRPELQLAAALVSQAREQGHVCLDLRAVGSSSTESLPGVSFPDWHDWRLALESAPVVGVPGDLKPLILDSGGRLYLRRYWWYEEQVAHHVWERCRANQETATPNESMLRAQLDQLFPNLDSSPNWQRVSAWVALHTKLCVITGGPGTGKTTTVVRILALLAEQAKPQKLRWAIAAPTGKAAARLQASLVTQKSQLTAQFPAAADLPDEVKTIHRWLGAIPDSPHFRHHAKRPLPIDVLVVDEASMVDLALMAKLLAAIPPHARIILLGDQDQLASVEAGNVLGDLCAVAEPNHFSPKLDQDFTRVMGSSLPTRQGVVASTELADGLVELTQNYRFGTNSGIHVGSQAVNRGDAEQALRVLEPTSTTTDGSLTGCRLPARPELHAALRERVMQYYASVIHATTPVEALQRIQQFRILAAVREGPYGVVSLNHIVEEILHDAGLRSRQSDWYPGRQILVTANDYSLNLFNGDLGLVFPDETGVLRVWFPGQDGTVRPLAPSRLPEHETAFVLTVHKSQGSEFEEVLLIMPDRSTRVLTRELIYTGLTRAKKRTEVWFDPAVFREAVARRTARASGLRDRLWGDGGLVC